MAEAATATSGIQAGGEFSRRRRRWRVGSEVEEPVCCCPDGVREPCARTCPAGGRPARWIDAIRHLGQPDRSIPSSVTAERGARPDPPDEAAGFDVLRAGLVVVLQLVP